MPAKLFFNGNYHWAGLLILVMHPQLGWCILVLLPKDGGRNWSLPGGYVDAHETKSDGTPDYLRAACREAGEEVGKRPSSRVHLILNDCSNVPGHQGKPGIAGQTFVWEGIKNMTPDQIYHEWFVNSQKPRSGHGEHRNIGFIPVSSKSFEVYDKDGCPIRVTRGTKVIGLQRSAQDSIKEYRRTCQGSGQPTNPVRQTPLHAGVGSAPLLTNFNVNDHVIATKNSSLQHYQRGWIGTVIGFTLKGHPLVSWDTSHKSHETNPANLEKCTAWRIGRHLVSIGSLVKAQLPSSHGNYSIGWRGKIVGQSKGHPRVQWDLTTSTYQTNPRSLVKA